MSPESAFLAHLRRIAPHPAARGLQDDAAVLAPPRDGQLVLTHDMLVEGVHYLPHDTPADVAWKLVAVNLSDLAAKGATPLGVLLGYPLGDPAWDAAFVAGLGAALAHFATPLLGGDTVAGRGPRTLGMTAIGHSSHAPDRRGARAGDALWVSGPIGDAGLGLALARAGRAAPAALLAAYRRPVPQLALGQALAPSVTAMSDVSDGLLIDAARMAAASGCAVEVNLATLPRSPAAIAHAGDGRAARLAAATAGDDYALLFAAPLSFRQPSSDMVACIGRFTAGAGLTLRDGDEAVPLPTRLGYEHDPSDAQGPP